MKRLVHIIAVNVCWSMGAACGPGQSSTEANGTTSETEATTGEAVPTSGGPTSGGPTSGEDPATSEPPTTDGPGSEATTDGPAKTCPEGQVSHSLRWELDIVSPASVDLFGVARGAAAMPDGSIGLGIEFLTSGGWVAGVKFVSALGELQGQVDVNTPPSDDVKAWALGVRADGRAVVVGSRRDDAGTHGWIGALSADGNTFAVQDLELTAMNRPFAVAHTADVSNVIAFDANTFTTWAGGFDADTGEAVWAVKLPGGLAASNIAAGPGGEIVVARGSWSGEEPASELRAWRFDANGATVWDRTFTPTDPGFGVMDGLAISPEGQVVVLETWPETGQVVANGLALADGSPQWRTLVVPGNDEHGGPRVGGVLATAGGVQVLVGQTDESQTLPVTATLHTLANDGAKVASQVLAIPERDGATLVVPTRGPCGDLLVMFGSGPTWLGSFAP